MSVDFSNLKELNSAMHGGICALWTMCETLTNNDDLSKGFFFVVNMLYEVCKQIEREIDGLDKMSEGANDGKKLH